MERERKEKGEWKVEQKKLDKKKFKLENLFKRGQITNKKEFEEDNYEQKQNDGQYAKEKWLNRMRNIDRKQR